MITPMKHEIIFLHANSELCSSRVGLFQANFVFFINFVNFWIDQFKFFGRPRHHFAHPDYKGGWPPMKSLNFNYYLHVFVLGVHFEFWGVFSFWVFGVWRNEWYHKSGRSRFIPARVRIQRDFVQTLILNWFLSFWFFCVGRNQWYHKSGSSRFILVRVRIQRARASKFDFGLVF